MYLPIVYFYMLHYCISWWFNGKESSCNARGMRDQVRSLSREDPLKKEMVTHSSIFACKIS